MAVSHGFVALPRGDVDWSAVCDCGISRLYSVSVLSHLSQHKHICNGVVRTLTKLRTSNGDYCIKQWFSSIVPFFKIETSLKGKNLLPEGANSLQLRPFSK